VRHYFGEHDSDETPTLGHWTQQDPLSYAPGDPNLYRYEGDRSPNSLDPQGTAKFVFPYFCICFGRWCWTMGVAVGYCTCTGIPIRPNVVGPGGEILNSQLYGELIASGKCCMKSCHDGMSGYDQPSSLMACLQRELREEFGPKVKCDCS
jgi:hypothetical protein